MAMNPEIWRYVFDAIEDPVFLHDAQFCVLLANRAYCRAAGVTEAQALGKPYWEVFPPGTGPLPGCKDAVSGKGQTSLQEEVNVGAKLFSSQEEVNVGEKLFLSKGYTVRDDQGKPLYSLHVLSDITAQRQGVAKLSESENHFRLIAETITEAFWMADVAVGKMFYISPAYEHIWGRSTQSLYENPGSFIEAIHPDDVTRVLADLELEKTGQPFDHEYRIHRPDGTLRWIWDRGFPIHEPTGEVLRYVGIAQDITERKRAEEALKKSEARYRSFIEVTGQLAWVTGADGAVVEDIPTWRAFAGMSAEQVKGWGWTEALHPDDRERAAQMWRDAVARKGVFEVEYRVRRRDGIYRDFFARGVPVLDASGGVREWVGTSIDITERKQAEMALRKSRDLLQSVVEHVPARIFWKDRDSRYLGCNSLFAKDAGLSRPDELISKTDFEMGWKDQAELYRAGDKATMESGTSKLDYEEPQTTPDGKTIWLRTSKVPLRDESKQVIGILGLYQDITDRKQAEQALREREEMLGKIAASAQDAILMLDNDGNIALWNAAAEKTFGYSSEEALGKNLHLLLAPARFHEAHRAAFVRFRSTGEGAVIGKTLELAALRKDGTEFPMELSLSAVKLKDQWHAVGILRDITKRKQAELALERANRALHTLSECNGALVRTGSESELLDSICRLIVETGGYRMAWVGFPEQNPVETVFPVAQYGHDEGYPEAVKISWADSVRGHGPSGTAIRTGTVQVNQNFLTNPALTLWREVAQPRGYHSSIALPLKNSAGTLGVLTIYASEPDAFDETEVTLLQELAEDLAFGIETLRTRAQRDRIVGEQLHDAELLRQSLQSFIKAIADTVEMRDPYTAGHQRRVGQLAIAIARELGLPEKAIHGIGLAASIHDLGKISVPAEILSKPTKLTAIELMLLKNHAQAGFDILKDIEFPWPIANMVLQHHERLDGSGYPSGLKGEQILLESRILAVADVVEAMSSHRPYRAALGIDAALQEIEHGRAILYDEAVVDACARLFAEKRFAFSS